MTQAILSFDAPVDARSRVAAYFQAHPGEWVSALTLAQVGGLLSSRTRISECRRHLSMHIENRTRRVSGPGGRWVVYSEFRYTP